MDTMRKEPTGSNHSHPFSAEPSSSTQIAADEHELHGEVIHRWLSRAGMLHADPPLQKAIAQ